MFVSITNSPRDYAWGSTSALAELFGVTASGGPEAELWLGAHPDSPSRIVNPDTAGGASDLMQWIASDPSAALGERKRLPFLMKVLAAASPLSLQAHPTAAQAREGFRRENALGIPLDAPHRNYRDEYPKPEIIVALSNNFEALCGFRPPDEAAEVLRAVGLVELVPMLDDLPALFAWLMDDGPEVQALRARLTALALETAEDGGLSPTGKGSVVGDAVQTVRRLAEAFPGDPGIVCALLLNRVTLHKGEALFLPAGNIHAYLEGVGIEVMTASDNVLRGGLTPKHVDIPELLRVLDFTQGPPPRLQPEQYSPWVEMYRPDADDFVLARVTGDAELPLTGPAIALCVAGSMATSGVKGSIELTRGECVYISPDEGAVTMKGRGEIFLATTP